MGHLCHECEICVQLKKGIVPKALDFGLAPCAAALEQCRVIQNSQKPNPQAEILLAELKYGHMATDPNVYFVDTDSDDDPPTPTKLEKETPPEKRGFKVIRGCMLC